MKYLYFCCVVFMISFAACTKDKVETDPCSSIVCQNNGICNNGECYCPNGFTGTFCDSSTVEVCDTLTCYNGGSCTNGRCNCVGDYYGTYCQFYYDYTNDTIICYTDVPYDPANCPTGLIGPTCTSFIHDVIIGTFPSTLNFSDNGTFPYQYEGVVRAGSSNTQFYFQVPQYSTDSILIERNVLQLTIPQQQYNGMSVQGNGSLLITNMSIYISFNLDNGNTVKQSSFWREAFIP